MLKPPRAMNCVEPVHRDRLCRWIETHHADGVGIEYQNPKNLSSESLLPPLAQAAPSPMQLCPNLPERHRYCSEDHHTRLLSPICF